MTETDIKHRPAKTWHKVIISTTADKAEIISSLLAAIPVDGIEQLAPPPDQPLPTTEKITAYLAETPLFPEQINTIRDFINQLNSQHPADNQSCCDVEIVREKDWNSNWKKHFKPFKLTNRIVIKPTWEPYTAQPHELIIEMDPGMAFGTGLHASTKLALLLIEQLFSRQLPTKVLDVGTGTGILGMSCALFGAKDILGLDNDLDARTAARDNINHNNITSFIISDDPLHEISGEFDLVIANITCDILLSLANDLTRRLAPGGSLILSGILDGRQQEEITKIITARNLVVKDSRQQDEWVAIHFIAAQHPGNPA